MSPHTERAPLTVVQAVVRDGSRVLLAVRSDLWGWELPGGTVENDEAMETALRREVREETGLEIEVLRHVGDYHRTGFRPHTAKVYLCRAVGGGEPRTSLESRDVRWFDRDSLPETLFPWYRQPLDDAERSAPEPVERRDHQGLATILKGLRIDLRMRFAGDEAGAMEAGSGSAEPQKQRAPAVTDGGATGKP